MWEHVGKGRAKDGAVAEAPVVDALIAKETVQQLHITGHSGGADVFGMFGYEGVGSAELGEQFVAGKLRADLTVERTGMRVEGAERASLDTMDVALLGVVQQSIRGKVRPTPRGSNETMLYL